MIPSWKFTIIRKTLPLSSSLSFSKGVRPPWVYRAKNQTLGTALRQAGG
jgi:hypothetical protein